MGALAKQFSNFLWATIGNTMDGRSAWEHMREMEQKEAYQLERATRLALEVYKITGNEKFLEKAAQFAERQANLRMANSKEVREMYKELAQALRDKAESIRLERAEKFMKEIAEYTKGDNSVKERSSFSFGDNFREATIKAIDEIRQKISEIQQDLQKLKTPAQQTSWEKQQVEELKNKIGQEQRQGQEQGQSQSHSDGRGR